MDKFRFVTDFVKTCAAGFSKAQASIRVELDNASRAYCYYSGKISEWTVYWMLYVSVVFESSSLTGAKWRCISWSPGLLVAVIIFSWINHHVNNVFMVSLPFSIAAAVPVNILIYNSQFCRAVYFLAVYDLTLRLLRMYIVQLVLYVSPYQFLLQNINVFLTAYNCTTTTTIDLGQNASQQVTAQAISVATSIMDSVGNVTDEIRDFVSPTISLLWSVLNSTSSIFQSISSSNEKCKKEMASLHGDCHKLILEAMTCKDKLGIFSILCVYLSPVSVACEKLQKGEICDVFSIADHFGEGLYDIQTSIKNLDNELLVDLGLDYGANMTSNNLLTELKHDFQEDITDTFGIVWYWYQCFGLLLACTIFNLIYKKTVLVKQLRKTGSLESEPISKFLLYTNPFNFQLIFILLNVLADSFVRITYEWHKAKLNQKQFEFNFNFFATVVLKNGGVIGALVANLFGNSLQKFEPIIISENLGKCFENDLSSPAYFTYFLSFLICYVGYRSYNIIGLHKYQQQLIIDIAYARWGQESESIMRRISFLFTSELLNDDRRQDDNEDRTNEHNSINNQGRKNDHSCNNDEDRNNGPDRKTDKGFSEAILDKYSASLTVLKNWEVIDKYVI